MLSDLRYQIFLSSTYEDLREERQQATQSILEMGHMPAGMELFPASDLSQWELIKRVIDESDYYLVIVGARYGSVHHQTELSFTEMEYDYAVKRGIPVLGFVRKDVENVAGKFTEKDPVSSKKLELFRQKVMSKICRQYTDPSDLGLMVMKSLMTETRINPGVGWVKADKARSAEDVARENELNEELKIANETIQKLQREIRDGAIEVDEIQTTDLAQGGDVLYLIANFTDSNKKLVSKKVEFTWDELFGVIGSQMYGYIVRRSDPKYNEAIGSYGFEGGLIEYIRSKIFESSGARQIKILPHQIDQFLIQFKQLGLVRYSEKDAEDGSNFRGFTLTELGEKHLMKIQTAKQ